MPAGRSVTGGSDAVREALGQVVEGRALDSAAMTAATAAIFAGEATAAQVAGFAVALRMRGETRDEIVAAARALREHCAAVDLEVDSPLLDTCGTGGDGAGTFNVSTVSAIVAAACGVKVAKHGNRAVSSRAGSADVLEALGVVIEAPDSTVRNALAAAGITFLFAPAHHGALRHAAGPRRELGVRTLFNLLGPLANPAGATHQLVGVYDAARVRPIAEVLGALGVSRAWVVHGDGGLDEVAPQGETRVSVWNGVTVEDRTLMPHDFGLAPASMASLAGGDAKTNADIARSILQGAPGGPRTVVLMNAGAALCVAEAAATPAEGAAMAAAAIDDGRAWDTLQRWIAATRAAV